MSEKDEKREPGLQLGEQAHVGGDAVGGDKATNQRAGRDIVKGSVNSTTYNGPVTFESGKTARLVAGGVLIFASLIIIAVVGMILYSTGQFPFAKPTIQPTSTLAVRPAAAA